MQVFVTNTQDFLSIDPKKIEPIIQCVLEAEGTSYDEASVHFLTKNQIAEYHQQFFDDPTPTDCITLPMDEETEDPHGYRVLGDLMICPEVAMDYAVEQQLDPYEEVTLYLVHCILHALGYDDIDPEAEQLMRKAEEKNMSLLKENDLLLRKTGN